MEIKFFKFEQKKSTEKPEKKPENEKKGNDFEKNKSWKETIRQKYELSLSKLKESADRLRKIRKIEKESGINTDKTEEGILEEIEILNEQVKSGYNLKNDENAELNDEKEKRGTIEFKNSGSEKAEEKNIDTELFINKFKEILISKASSSAYLERLTAEFKGDKQKASEEQAKRIENIKNVNVVIFENELEFREKLEELKKEGVEFNCELEKLKGAYLDRNHTIYSQRDFSILAHELFHSETRGEKDMSESAKKILDDSYLKQGFLNIFSGKDDEYLSHPAERLEGKRDLEYSLEILNIKKYDEPFTEEHYDKMMKAYKEGRIKGNAGIFIERTINEDFKKIFDEIAKNENSGEREMAA